LIYKKAWKYYCEHGFARPIANLKASAAFGKGIHWSGDNEQVAFAKKLFDQIELFQVDLESGLYGDTFIRWFKGQNGGEHKIAIIPPETIDKETKESNVLEVEKYIQYKGNSELEERIEPNEIIHIMANAVSNSKFGNSDFKHLFYYFDLYNSLVEGADKRRLFFSSPIGKLMGIDLRFRSTIKTTIGKRTRDVDQKTGIRSSLPPGSMIMLPKGADYDFAEHKGKFDLEVMILRVARTIATASNTPLHWLNLAEDVNRATAREMAFPFIKEVLRRQKLYGRKFEELLRFIYDDDPTAFPFDKDKNPEGKFQLRALFPPIFDYDLDDIERMVKAILAINMQGNLSGQTILDLICNYFGLDVEEEQKRLDQEEEEDKYTPVEKAVREVGKAVAGKEITKEVGTKLIKKLSEV